MGWRNSVLSALDDAAKHLERARMYARVPLEGGIGPPDAYRICVESIRAINALAEAAEVLEDSCDVDAERAIAEAAQKPVNGQA